MLFFTSEFYPDDKMREYLKAELERATGEKCIILPDSIRFLNSVPVKNDAAPTGEAAPQD